MKEKKLLIVLIKQPLEKADGGIAEERNDLMHLKDAFEYSVVINNNKMHF